MPWPSKITRAFATVEVEAHESQYYGPYNKLLCTLFPPDSDFTVSPNYIPGYVDGGADFIVSFEITFHQHPVLVLEIKPPHHLSLISTREVADRHIRRRLADLSERSLLPVLHGVSAIGTKLCFYEFEKTSGRMSPRRIPSDPELVTDVAPKVRWDCDILEASGEQRLRVLATQIIEACERLQA
ncbi:hypothetical protein K488DRAFT_56019 [Vararia minispora EC-137]|uniref:Uncharacterized protein n=1 Tax=Vararia minispora EC-137 TaxID=1314806 RepID=A0ACB8QCV3_9AGAM|nr:hypothetical protein K488DRAFT_56019 [Vararia minispora EC-137]